MTHYAQPHREERYQIASGHARLPYVFKKTGFNQTRMAGKIRHGIPFSDGLRTNAMTTAARASSAAARAASPQYMQIWGDSATVEQVQHLLGIEAWIFARALAVAGHG